MASSFWKGKKVLVTGGDGFIGSHLTEKLLELGANVSILVKSKIDKTGPVLVNLKHLIDSIEILNVSVAENDCITHILKNKPKIIFHLAAIAYVNYSFEHPFETVRVNDYGTLNVLQAAMNLDVERLVVTSSSEVYGTAQKDMIDEDHPLNPTSPYAASKVAADRIAYSFWKTYNLPIAIIRPFNTYGPRHTYDVIPKFIKLALKNEPVTIYGSGEQSRDFTYVDDMVRAFLTMGSHKSAVGQVINFGTGKHVSINETAEKIVKISQSKSKIVHVEKRLAEVARLTCDYSKAKKLLGWEPQVSVDEGLKRNIDWDRKHLKI
jgi:dTDP-glucose 4,6-dehydratase